MHSGSPQGGLRVSHMGHTYKLRSRRSYRLDYRGALSEFLWVTGFRSEAPRKLKPSQAAT